MKPFLISITGGSGSGKTYLANQLLNNYGKNKISIIQVDSYYKDLKHLTMNEREKNNFDHPNAFDFNLLYKHLCRLSKSAIIEIPSYDYKTHTRNIEKLKINQTPIIIIEGIFSTYYKEIRKMINLNVFLDIPENIRKERRLIRDEKSRARTKKSILEQYNKTVKPMYAKFVEPLIKYSDLIIKDNSINTNEINILNNQIKSILNNNYEK
tara:strand:+ start:986 stop:1615 length:630 start_codon:yes stop_codon:yes gene_type:complete